MVPRAEQSQWSTRSESRAFELDLGSLVGQEALQGGEESVPCYPLGSPVCLHSKIRNVHTHSWTPQCQTGSHV